MADYGLKIHDTLAFHQYSLTIPPSNDNNIQILKSDVTKTSKTVNLRIYVEPAIKRTKDY